jgi:hypothetical protein
MDYNLKYKDLERGAIDGRFNGMGGVADGR